MENNLPVVCTLSSEEKAKRGEQIARDLLSGVVETKDLPDGTQLRFPGDEYWTMNLTQFVAFEQECCRFLTFELNFEPNLGSIWMCIRGSGEAVSFIKSSFR